MDKKKPQQWFKRIILERFMDEDKLEEFEEEYREARFVNLGKRYGLDKN